MKLTRRQEEVLHSLLDLYRTAQGPLHYTMLAERLGVNRFTAYDMLRLLEEKGLVESSYRVEGSGPGRSEVLYAPTQRAHRLIARAADEVGGADWEETKERLLRRLRRGEMHDQTLAEEMLARVPPEAPDDIRYCVEIMTVVALRLRRHTGRRVLLDFLPRLLPDDGACRPHLSLLGGFALGVLAEERDADWSEELLAHVLAYQELVVDMEPARCRELAASLHRLFAPLLAGSTTKDKDNEKDIDDGIID